MQQAFIGIDVGTSSARAGVFDENGTLLATARHPITLWHEVGHYLGVDSTKDGRDLDQALEKVNRQS